MNDNTLTAQTEPGLRRWRRQTWAMILTLIGPGLGEVYLGAWKSGVILLVVQAVVVQLFPFVRRVSDPRLYFGLVCGFLLLGIGFWIVGFVRLAPHLSGALVVSGKRWFRSTWFTAICFFGIQYAIPAPDTVPVKGRIFNIPSSSMIPTLQLGDYLVTSRFDPASPQAGDVIIFPLPSDPKVDYVKRVIGLPSDRVQVRQGRLYINGSVAPRTAIGDDIEDEGASRINAKRFAETLPNGRTYEILKRTDGTLMVAPDVDINNTIEYVVPPGMAFVLGDNRDNSLDSREMAKVGFIPLASIKGRNGMIFYARNTARIFSAIH